MDLRKILVDGLPVETNDAGATVIEKLQKDIADANQRIEALASDHQKALDEKDGELGKLKAENKKLSDAQVTPEQLTTLIAERSALIDVAHKVDPKIATDNLDSAGIRRATVAAKMGDDAVKEVSDATVAGMFAVIAADAKAGKSDDPVQTALKATDRSAQTEADQTKRDDPNGQKAYEARTRDAWKGNPANAA